MRTPAFGWFELWTRAPVELEAFLWCAFGWTATALGAGPGVGRSLIESNGRPIGLLAVDPEADRDRLVPAALVLDLSDAAGVAMNAGADAVLGVEGLVRPLYLRAEFLLPGGPGFALCEPWGGGVPSYGDPEGVALPIVLASLEPVAALQVLDGLFDALGVGLAFRVRRPWREEEAAGLCEGHAVLGLHVPDAGAAVARCTRAGAVPYGREHGPERLLWAPGGLPLRLVEA